MQVSRSPRDLHIRLIGYPIRLVLAAGIYVLLVRTTAPGFME